jgi:hypothetical protein
MQDSDLDAFFNVARDVPPDVSDALMARVLADADAHQPRDVVAKAAVPGIWNRLLAAIGGGPALAGLSTAALCGVWIGFAQPGQVADLLLVGSTATETLDVFPAFDDFVPAFDDFVIEG